jgi:hypothetical protein
MCSGVTGIYFLQVEGGSYSFKKNEFRKVFLEKGMG